MGSHVVSNNIKWLLLDSAPIPRHIGRTGHRHCIRHRTRSRVLDFVEGRARRDRLFAVGACCREQDVVCCLFMNHEYSWNGEATWNLMRISILEMLTRWERERRCSHLKSIISLHHTREGFNNRRLPTLGLLETHDHQSRRENTSSDTTT